MAIVRDIYELDPYSNSLFLFCGRRCDRIKALHFENYPQPFGYPHIFSFYTKICSFPEKICG